MKHNTLHAEFNILKKLIFFSIILSYFIGCKNDFYVHYTNWESDKREGEKVMEVYFDNLLLGKEPKNLNLLSKELLKNNDKEKIHKQQEYILKKLGKVLGKELVKWETSVVKSMEPKSEYLFVYKVKREKYNSVETFYLIKEDTDSIKIQSYDIKSDGFLTEE